MQDILLKIVLILVTAICGAFTGNSINVNRSLETRVSVLENSLFYISKNLDEIKELLKK